MTASTARTIALLALVGAALAGCAQPGQLGSPQPTPPPAAVTPPSPAPPTTAPPSGPTLLGSGLIDDRVTIRTPGPAEFFVSRVVVPPGGSTGWHSHPGTETSLVSSGAVTLLREDDCAGTTVPAGRAVFIPDQQPHLARNDGAVPAELIVTYLLAPGAPDRVAVADPC